MTISWVRLWHDMPTDPKWRVIAKRSGRPIAEVIAVFTMLLTNASANATERGRTHNWSDEDAAATLDIETEHVAAIRDAMQGKILDGDKLSGWEKRQPKREDNSAERAKEWRERKRTQPNAQERPYPYPDPDADLGTTTPSESGAARDRRQAVKDLVGCGLGGGIKRPISPEAKRKVCAKLAIADAEPLVMAFEEWKSAPPARDRDALFISSAEKFLSKASPEVRAACRPLASEFVVAPVNVRPSPELAASLRSAGRRARG